MNSYAIVPAAGHGRRMGTQKLLLPWKNETVIQSVLRAWQSSQATETFVIVREQDDELIQVCKSVKATIVAASNPPDMKASVQCAIEFIAKAREPNDEDAWLLAPADMPRLSTVVIDQMLLAFSGIEPRSAWVPTVNDVRGHPVVFPWSLACEVAKLETHEGVNSLLNRHPYRTLQLDSRSVLDDLDTPEDYRRLHNP